MRPCQLIWKTFHNTFTNLARRSSDKSKSVPLDYNEQNALQDRKIIGSLSRCQPVAASLLADPSAGSRAGTFLNIIALSIAIDMVKFLK